MALLVRGGAPGITGSSANILFGIRHVPFYASTGSPRADAPDIASINAIFYGQRLRQADVFVSLFCSFVLLGV